MLKLIFKVLFFIAIILILDRIIGKTIFYVSLNSSLFNDKRLLYILENKINADVLIIGSSRAARNIIAKEMEKYTGITTYNMGYPGSNIDFHEFLLRVIISTKYIPKCIILTVDDDAELKYNDSIKFRFDVLYPLIEHRNSIVLNEMIGRNIYESEFLVKYSKIYASRNQFYNLMNLSTLMGLIGIKMTNENDILNAILPCGSMPLSIKSKNFNDMTYNKYRPVYDIKKENKLLKEKYISFVKLCQQNNIELIVISTPNFFQPSIGFMNRIESLSGNNVIFIDYSDNTIVDKRYYYDKSHLDYSGAQIFTKILSKDFILIK